MARENEGKKELGLPELIAIGVGGMIGGGIFSVLGLTVDIAGHAAPLAFVAGSCIAMVAGYSYSKLALAFRSDGASFTYLEHAFPEKPAIAAVAGRIVVAGYMGTLSLYAFTFGAYASHLLGLSSVEWVRGLLSTGVLLFFLGVNLIGTKEMGRIEDLIVYVKIVFLAILGIAGFFTLDATRFEPVFDHSVSSIFLAGALIFVAFEGFELITNAVMEIENPKRNLPLGIYGSILIVSFIYIAIAIVSVGNLDVAALKSAEEYALSVVAKPILGKAGVILVDLAAMLATSSAINATLFGASRLSYEMSKEHLAPKAFSFRNRNDIPAFSLWFVSGFAILFSFFGSLEVITSFSSMTFLLASMGVCLANLKLRKKTQSRLPLIIAGLVLMGITVAILFSYMLNDNPAALLITGCIYAALIVAYLIFKNARKA